MKYSWLGSLLAFFIILAILLFGFDHTVNEFDGQDLKRMEDAIAKAVNTCYSIEGFYPSSLDYLEENYHLLVNQDHYQIHYEWIADNVRPNIFVFLKGGE